MSDEKKIPVDRGGESLVGGEARSVSSRRAMMTGAIVATAGAGVALAAAQPAAAAMPHTPWVREGLGTSVKARGYGAVGDGTSDDIAAIQAAVDDVLDAGGGSVVFPAGTYAVSAPITVAQGNRPDRDLRFELVGEGAASRIVRYNVDGAHPLVVIAGQVDQGNIRQCALRHLGLGRKGGAAYPPGEWPSDGPAAVVMRHLGEFTVQGCFVDQRNGDSVSHAAGGPGFDLTDTLIGTFIENRIEGNSDGVVLNGVANAIRFIGNRIYNNSGVGIRFPTSEPSPKYGASRAVNVYIAGNDIERNGAQGILLTGARYDQINIIGNHFEKNWHPVYTNEVGPYIEKTKTGTECAGVTIIGNRVNWHAHPKTIVFEEGRDITLLANTAGAYHMGEAVENWVAHPANGGGTLEMDGDLRIRGPQEGVILTSPNGSRYRLTVSDSGEVTVQNE